jgi:hypothetical protein
MEAAVAAVEAAKRAEREAAIAAAEVAEAAELEEKDRGADAMDVDGGHPRRLGGTATATTPTTSSISSAMRTCA